MTAMNGVPWWFAHGNEFGSVPLRAVDEHGLLSAIVDLKKIVGAVVNIAARVERLGVVHHIAGCSLSVGPAIPSAIDRASMVQQCFAETGITIDISGKACG
jgi:ketopantoate reductase